MTDNQPNTNSSSIPKTSSQGPSFKGAVPSQDTIPDDSIQMQKVPKWVIRFNDWRKRVMSEFVFMLWLAAVIGLFSGLFAHIFNWMITFVSDIFLKYIRPDSVNWWLLFVPVAGILLTGIFTRYIVRTNLTHGVTRLMYDIYHEKFKLKRNLVFSPIIGSTITLGFGGSAGSEGPIAYTGAAIGSNLGRILGLQPAMLRVLIGCGAAAGISGIFMSPVGGLLFTLEFLKLELTTLSILAATLACLVAYGVVFACNGCVSATTFMPDANLPPSHFWIVIILGILCGFYSLYYSRVINFTDILCRKMANPWWRNIIGGAFVGVCLLLFPSLYGVGYPVMSATIHDNFESLMEGNVLSGVHLGDWTLMIVAFLILVIKCWACGTTNACGGVSSDFAPTLYAGAVAGFLFAMFCNHVLDAGLHVGVFTFIGMAGVMAGTIEAPLMTIFIVLNMGISFDFALPIGICVYSSYMTVRLCSHLRGYDSKMVKHVQWFHGNKKEQTSDQG